MLIFDNIFLLCKNKNTPLKSIRKEKNRFITNCVSKPDEEDNASG